MLLERWIYWWLSLCSTQRHKPFTNISKFRQSLTANKETAPESSLYIPFSCIIAWPVRAKLWHLSRAITVAGFTIRTINTVFYHWLVAITLFNAWKWAFIISWRLTSGVLGTIWRRPNFVVRLRFCLNFVRFLAIKNCLPRIDQLELDYLNHTFHT